MFDSETNTVYFASCLKDRYPEIWFEATEFLTQNGIEVYTIPSTNLWIRDWAPVQIPSGRFIKFKNTYDKRYPWLKVSPACYKEFNPIYSNIKLDGGNCQRYGDRAILTTSVLKQNPKLKISKLEELLQSEVFLILPEPFCTPAHSDGILHFIPGGGLIVNNYPGRKQKYYLDYYKKLMKALNRFSIVGYLPYPVDKTPRMSEKLFRKLYLLADVFCSAYGCYINYLEVGNLVLIPGFGIVEDLEAKEKIAELYPNHKILQLDFSQISILGGCANCISWNVRDNGDPKPKPVSN